MKKLIVAAAALAFLVAPVGDEWSDAQAKGNKSITAEVDGWKVTGKKCLIKKRCDFKLLVKKGPATQKATLYGGGDWGRDGRGGGGRGDWGRGRGPGWGRGPGYRPGYYPGAEVAAGVVIGGAISNWLFPPKPEVVVVERPGRDEEGRDEEADEGVTLKPWSSDWYSYCGNKYQTFDAKTGFYTTADGRKVFCK